jgi:hypothetical protein
MKTNTLSPKHGVTKFASLNYFSPLFICFLFFTATLILSGCKDDDDDDTSPDVSKLVGTYDVEETDMNNNVDNYTVTISKSKDGGPNIEISNFGDFILVPVKGTIVGNTLTIPSQTFTANSTIKISGNGTLTGNNLHFDYTMDALGDTFEYSCEATKQ